MNIIVNTRNEAVVAVSPILKEHQDKGVYFIKEVATSNSPKQVSISGKTVYDVPVGDFPETLPEMQKPENKGKYCYNQADGFYPNPRWG
jgi:hypothetical protein